MAKRLKLDFTGIEAYLRCEEGRHRVKLTAIEETESQAGNDMLNATFKVIKGTSTGATLYENFPLTEKALWKFQSFLNAVGVKANGKVVVDLDKLIGKICDVQVAHEEYEGKTRARIQEFLSPKAAAPEEDEDDDDLPFDDEDEEEEEEPPKRKAAKKKAPPKKKAPKKKPIEEDDEWDDDEWDDED